MKLALLKVDKKPIEFYLGFHVHSGHHGEHPCFIAEFRGPKVITTIARFNLDDLHKAIRSWWLEVK